MGAVNYVLHMNNFQIYQQLNNEINYHLFNSIYQNNRWIIISNSFITWFYGKYDAKYEFSRYFLQKLRQKDNARIVGIKINDSVITSKTCAK